VLSAKLLELIEESRAQMADENIKVWKAFEVTNQMVCDLYNANRTDARLEKTAMCMVHVASSTPYGRG
jgi:hypothetical protein